MMRKGVLTVYLSIIMLIILSLVLVSLESVRVYVAGTAVERYADMAGEMVFSAYVRPMADRYGIFVLDKGTGDGYADVFREYLGLNLEEGQKNRGRVFNMYGVVQDVRAVAAAAPSDDNWRAVKEQIVRYEEYALGEKGVGSVKNILEAFVQSGMGDTVEAYTGQLASEGPAMDRAIAEAEQSEKQEGNSDNPADETLSPVAPVEDPRRGISRWLKSGLLDLVMGDKAISGRQIDVSQCSYQVSTGSKWKVLDSFESYHSVASLLDGQRMYEKIKQEAKDYGSHMMINLYILDRFRRLCKDSEEDSDTRTVLAYETEYILYGHKTDRENLENAVTGIFALRTVLNLIYLYTNQGKSQVIQGVVRAMSAASAIPVVGEVLKLLMIACWSAAEAVVDCAALADGKRVPVIKNDNSWNLSMEQLLAIGKRGGQAADYVRDGSRGFSYEQYLFVLLLFTDGSEKLVRMSQLMESNIRLEEGYEDFKLSNCITSAELEGTAVIQPLLWQHPSLIQHHFYVEYGYE